MSQYDAHLRAILGLSFPPPSPDADAGAISSSGTDMINPAVMLNILGGSEPDTHMAVSRLAMNTRGARLHLYGKGDARPGRKMGHVTITANDMAQAETWMRPLVDAVDAVRAERMSGAQPSSAGTAAKSHRADSSSTDTKTNPVVAVTMGSDSDLPVLKPGLALLTELNIPFEVTITSAHRTPSRMFDYAREASSRGIKVIIAAAGGAAHLPGMIASSTPLPVVGVPVKGSTLDGMDSLLSIVQMPVCYLMCRDCTSENPSNGPIAKLSNREAYQSQP